jgi:hypothetical protein
VVRAGFFPLVKAIADQDLPPSASPSPTDPTNPRAGRPLSPARAFPPSPAEPDMPDTPAPSEHSAAARRARKRLRSLDTRRSVIWGEKIAGGVITVGGLMVIFAVLGIMIFLFRVVMPLMDGGEMLGNVRYQLDTEQDVIWVNGDEFQTLGIAVAAEGRVITYHVPTGTECRAHPARFRRRRGHRRFRHAGARPGRTSASTTARCALPNWVSRRRPPPGATCPRAASSMTATGCAMGASSPRSAPATSARCRA